MIVHILPRDIGLGSFDWQFLIWLLGFGLVEILFVFYFNRFIAFALFALIRAYTWFFYRVHIRCQSIQFSLLGGRVFFRGLHYSGENETIVVHQAYVTWRYWYRRVADVDLDRRGPDGVSELSSDSSKKLNEDVGQDNEANKSAQKRSVPCRISAHIRGIEWFVYNRSPAYDAIIASAARTAVEGSNRIPSDGSVDETSIFDVVNEEKPGIGPTSPPRTAHYPEQTYSRKAGAELPVFLKLLPIYVECTKGAMVMGNSHTRCVLVAKIDGATGRITASPCGIHDKYRQNFDIEFIKPLIQFKPNEDYVEPQLALGTRLNGAETDSEPKNHLKGSRHLHKVSKHRARQFLSKLFPRYQKSVESFNRMSNSIRRNSGTSTVEADNPGHPKWIGLSRYLDEEEEEELEHERWRQVEYAEVQKIADCPKINMNFFWDVPGTVPPRYQTDGSEFPNDFREDVNHSAPPAWGVELHIDGGTVHYGPWADRQRVDLMMCFFPPAFTNASPALPLRPGQSRISTVFKILIILDGKVNLRLHSREPSKDWKFKTSPQESSAGVPSKSRKKPSKGKRQAKLGADVSDRPAAWLNVSFEANTTVTFNLDMLARKSGFQNKLFIHAVSPEIHTSVNQDLLLRAKSQTISCSLPNPLCWNEHRTWQFDISSYDLELFMLREHAFLIQDLVEDFTVGPVADFYTFIPFHYSMHLVFDSVSLFLNANDANIIDKPSDPAENTFFVLRSQELVADVGIPADRLKPVQNQISFGGKLKHTSLDVITPAWNTYNALLLSPEVGFFPEIVAKGSYNYMTSTSPSNTDTLVMQIHGIEPKMYLFGFLIKYFMSFKENYFGEDVHFQTIEEYQRRLSRPGRKHAADNDHKPVKPANDLDVILSITTEHPCIMLPGKLYSNDDCVRVDMSSGDADLRFTNYYMDLQTSISPLSISHVVSKNTYVNRDPGDIGAQTFVDGITITGHRLFGLPPTEPTYVCNWDFSVGHVTGESSMEYLNCLVSGMQCLAYGLDDNENALPEQGEARIHDVTFLRASLGPVRLWLRVDQLAFLCELDASRVEFNDWARHRFSERMHLAVPNVVLACVDASVATRHNNCNLQKALTYGYLQTSVDVRMVEPKANFKQDRLWQQEHLRLQDARTSRTPWLLQDQVSLSASHLQPQVAKLQPPASSFPLMPEPLQISELDWQRQEQDLASIGSLRSIVSVHEHGSYLSKPTLNTKTESGRFVGSGSRGKESSRPGAAQRRSARERDGGADIQQSSLPHDMSFSSPYEIPHFPLQLLQPVDDDVPIPYIPSIELRERSRSDLTADQIPIDDDEMVHMTLMFALDSGLRVMCTPPAVEGINRMLVALQNKNPDSLLDSLQMMSLNAVAASSRHKEIPKSLQVRLEIPGAAVRFRHHHVDQLTYANQQQTYDVALRDLVAIGRLGADRGEPLGRTPSSMHVSLDQFELEARRSPPKHADNARILIKLSDLTLWLFEAEQNTGELQFRALEIASLNEQVEHLASLINEAGTLANNLGTAFRTTMLAQVARLQYLVHSLTELGSHVTDPMVLGSASYVTRSSANHIRASDSWKMIMRLRWILHSMNGDSIQVLADACTKTSLNLPEEAQVRVVSSFIRWRSWDLEHVRGSALMQQLYGKTMPAPKATLQSVGKPVRFRFLSGIISLVIDPGRRRNKFVVEGLGAAVQSAIDISDPESDLWNSAYTVRKTTIELVCETSLIELRLELLDAVKDIFAHIKSIEAEHYPEITGAQPPKEDNPKQQTHLVLAVKRNVIHFRSQHLKTHLTTDGFSFSLVGATESEDRLLATALLTARKSSLQTRVRSQTLIKMAIVRPSVYGNMKKIVANSQLHFDWNIGAQSEHIEIDILESALGLLDVADQILGNEVVYLQEIIRELQKADDLVPASQSSTAPAKHTARVTFQLHSYDIRTVIFSTLHYRLRGQTARTSITPGPKVGKSYIISVDIKNHAHIVFNNQNGEEHTISELILPPVNAVIAIVNDCGITTTDVSLHIARIVLDASAVHGLFTTFSRSELMHFRQDVLRDLGNLQANYRTISKRRELPTSPISSHQPVEDQSPLHYSGQINIAGVAITTRSSKSLKISAKLLVDSGPVYLGVRNTQASSDTLLPFPDLDIRLDQIRILLESLRDQQRVPCGSVTLAFSLYGESELNEDRVVRAYRAMVDRLAVDIYTETASMIIDMMGYLQQRFKQFNLNDELHNLRVHRRKRAKSNILAADLPMAIPMNEDDLPVALFDAMLSFEMRQTQIAWRVGTLELKSPITEPEDLIFSVESIDLRTREGNTARLQIQALQLQMVPVSQQSSIRSKNSALLPDVVFKIAYQSRARDRKLAFQATGKALDLRLSSKFILPAAHIQRSIGVATQDLRKVLKDWNETLTEGNSKQTSVFGEKQLASLVIDADFAGAVVYLEGKEITDQRRISRVGKNQDNRHGRFGQFTQADSRSATTLRSPGLAFKVEFSDALQAGKYLNAEVKIAASKNTLHPMFVPLVFEIVSSVKDMVGEEATTKEAEQQTTLTNLAPQQGSDITSDPTAILGDCKLNLGFRIAEQSFGLTCEPIAQVSATTRFENIYITISTVQPVEQERFFAVSASIRGLETAVQHVYSREPTGRFEIDSINLSLMNSKHLGGSNGISSILNFSPMKVILNVKQLQDFLLFREIWYPIEIRPRPQPPTRSPSPAKVGVQRYQQATGSNAFSWSAALHVSSLELQLDLGQAVGKTSFSISKLWVASKKDSEYEQNLCLGFESIGMQSKGRMSGTIELRNMRVRTNIIWPKHATGNTTPLVQASLGFDDLRAKAAFDYQVVAIADFQTLEFLLYNITEHGRDRLVCSVNGDKIQAFATANAAAQAVALYQAVDRLIQEKLAAFQSSLKAMENFQRQKAAAGLGLSSSQELSRSQMTDKIDDQYFAPLRLQVNVVVTLNALRTGIYPRAFTDNQIFKLEALDALARFGVSLQDDRVNTLLTVVLGQVRVALSAVDRPQRLKSLGDVSIEEVVRDSTNSRGGTILKVPRVVATMQTWQVYHTKHVEYIFKSTFEGKVEVGWNYSRISFIRAMWNTHSQALVQRLGKPLPQSAVQIRSGPRQDAENYEKNVDGEAQDKITAVVNVPLSRYTYSAREPPVIQTPQLKDMGEATPPLEWIGLQRDKLPNLTHQIVIVPLLEFAKEVEDAYGKILGAT